MDCQRSPDATPLEAAARARLGWLGEDRAWLVVLGAVTGIELAWWAIYWSLGLAPALHLFAHVGLAGVAVAVAIGVRRALRLDPLGPGWPVAILGAALFAAGASAFLPLKHAIPRVIPFWLDGPLARLERNAFGADPWLLLDRLAGWATIPMDWLYGTWLPVQSVVFFLVVLARPSPAKSRALIAYAVAWLVLGVVAAALLSSAGPLFYDRIFGGASFAALGDTLRQRGAWVALAESDRMWASMSEPRPGLVAGISAVPSMHVAISLWLALTVRKLAPGAAGLAWAYLLIILLGSVQLGWHYVSDGLAGALGMLAIWWLSGVAERRRQARANAAERP